MIIRVSERYEKDKARKLAAHRRAVLRVESRIAEHLRRIQDLTAKRAEENRKIKATFLELSNLHKVRYCDFYPLLFDLLNFSTKL